MNALGILFLVCGLFFTFKAFTAPNLYSGGRRRLTTFGEDAGKIDCGIVAALMFIGAFSFLYNR